MRPARHRRQLRFESKSRSAVKRRRRDLPEGRHRRQLSFSEVIRGVNQRAWRRSHQPTVQRAIADSHAGDLRDDFMVRHFWMRRILAILVLFPVSVLTTRAFFIEVSETRLEFWIGREFWHFSLGLFLWSIIFFTNMWRSASLYLYVLGHELTHAIFVLLSLGKIGGMHVSTRGGYVLTNKTNLFIALSPYFVPFWSMVLMLIYGLASFFWELPKTSNYLLMGLGFTWGFHLLWTLWMIPKDQPDLKENGTLFSLLFVYLINLFFIIAMMVFASAIHPIAFVRNWLSGMYQAKDILMTLAEYLFS